jgi:hypothetical protein
VSWQDEADKEGYETGPCFALGNYRAQDLWVRASSPNRMAREGEPFTFDVEAGYYSGGVAARAEVEGGDATLVEQRDFASVHPRWRGFSFSHPDLRWAGGTLDIDAPASQHLDAAGRGHWVFPLKVDANGSEAPAPDFGTLRISMDVRLSDRESTSSNAVTVPYARYARYVGLKVDPAWPGGASPITMQAVVATAEGEAVTDAPPVQVEVFRRAAQGKERTRVHACSLVAGAAPVACAFPRTQSGWYDIEARSGDAAPATVQQYIVVDNDPNPVKPDGDPVEVEPMDGAIVRGQPAPLRIRLGDTPAQLLLTVWGGEALLDARVVHVDVPMMRFDLPTRADWPQNVRLEALVRVPPTGRDALPAGFRVPFKLITRPGSLQFVPAPKVEPIAMAFEPSRATPGAGARLPLRNTTDRPRTIALTVLDDALRALGANYDLLFDPQGENRPFEGYVDPTSHGFDDGDWNHGNAWRWLIDRRNPDCIIEGTERCALVGDGSINPIDVSQVESTEILTAEQISKLPMPRDVTTVHLVAPDAPRQNAAAPAFGYDRDASGLDTVEVVAAGMIAPVNPPETPPQPRDPVRPLSTAASLDPALARVRVRFTDTVLWRNDIVLAAGESKTIDIALPDNLTRWRAIAWSDDGAAEFARVDATLDTGLPVEARLQAPARIYPGDTTRIAANIRHTADHAAQADARLTFAGEGVDAHHAATLALAPAGQASFGATFAPTQPGQVALTAAAATPDGRDAIASPLDVASTDIASHRAQAGWLGAMPVALALPALPTGASDARVRVALWRGHDALAHEWTDALRTYEHRCWEQILSRAVAAALAIERGDTTWPDAKAVVQEALDNAAVFQHYRGSMQFFPGDGYSANWATPALTAYTVDAFALLRELGYDTPDAVEEKARQSLREVNDKVPDTLAPDALARIPQGELADRAIAAAIEPVDAKVVDAVAASMPKLPLTAKIAAVRTLAGASDPRTPDAMRTLLDAAPQRGDVRFVPAARTSGLWMSSPLREQCEMIRLLQDYPQYAPTGARAALVRGVLDLYAGGGGYVDTQAGATCLSALRAERRVPGAPVEADAHVGGESHRITLAAGASRSEVVFDAAPVGTVSIAATGEPASPVAYVARVDWHEDARHAQRNAVGLTVARRYETLRNNRWVPIPGGLLRDGDWVRITLVVETADSRWYVAVTDDLPGGLLPVDLTLAGVAGVDVHALADDGSAAFSERKLDARRPRFYARALTPGRHEIHYFARVANTGTYLAAPAVVELMYGEATHARTESDRIRIADPAPPPRKSH